MIMETLTISRFLEGIFCKEFHKVQDVVNEEENKSSLKLSAVKTIQSQCPHAVVIVKSNTDKWQWKCGHRHFHGRVYL